MHATFLAADRALVAERAHAHEADAVPTCGEVNQRCEAATLDARERDRRPTGRFRATAPQGRLARPRGSRIPGRACGVPSCARQRCPRSTLYPDLAGGRANGAENATASCRGRGAAFGSAAQAATTRLSWSGAGARFAPTAEHPQNARLCISRGINLREFNQEADGRVTPSRPPEPSEEGCLMSSGSSHELKILAHFQSNHLEGLGANAVRTRVNANSFERPCTPASPSGRVPTDKQSGATRPVPRCAPLSYDNLRMPGERRAHTRPPKQFSGAAVGQVASTGTATGSRTAARTSAAAGASRASAAACTRAAAGASRAACASAAAGASRAARARARAAAGASRAARARACTAAATGAAASAVIRAVVAASVRSREGQRAD